jgi:hypothetical protein
MAFFAEHEILPGGAMSLTSEFKDDPQAFLKSKVVIVPEETDTSVGSSTLCKFMLKPHGSNSVLLVIQNEADGEYVKGYYLKWAVDRATTMDLADAADFFFTSQLTNCRFSILADNPRTPKVAHVAGNTNAKDRNTWELEAGFVDASSAKRARRLSVSQGFDPSVHKKPKEHRYVGQRFSASSAFVFGRRENEIWKFYAQVVKGNMSAPANIDLTTDLTILKYPKTDEALMEL